jgi:nucleotide-binding universal stress UspA family protein
MSGAELVLTHVLTEAPLFREGPFIMPKVREVFEAARSFGETALEEWVAKARAEGLSARAALRTGVVYQEIVALAVDERADLVVIGRTVAAGSTARCSGAWPIAWCDSHGVRCSRSASRREHMTTRSLHFSIRPAWR